MAVILIKESFDDKIPRGWKKDDRGVGDRYLYQSKDILASMSVTNTLADPREVRTIISIMDLKNPDSSEQIDYTTKISNVDRDWSKVVKSSLVKADDAVKSHLGSEDLDESTESRLGDNYDKKLDLFQKIEDLIKEYPDIETHVVEEIFGGKDKFDSYDVSKHKVNEVANLLGRVKRYVEDNVGYDKTQVKNESLKEDLDSEWRELETKQITDFDGFLTDYTLYTNGVTYICMYGDKDVYSPDIDEADYESDSEDEAYEWFNNYNGFDEDYIDECANMVSKVNESKLTEGYYDISVDDIRGVISRLEDLVSGLEDLGMSSIKPVTNTYGMRNFVGIASKGYIDLDRIDDYLGDSEDEEY